MVNKIEAISKKKHLNYSFLPLNKSSNNFSSFAKVSNCPIYLSEIKDIALYFPIFFTKDKNEEFSIKCLFSLINDHNVFINKKGNFTALYLPVYFRCFPFVIASNEKTNEKLLCFRTKTELLKKARDKKYIPFFDKNGQLSNTLKDIMQILNILEHEKDKTINAINLLKENELIVEWPVTLKFTDGEKKLEGIYRIDENKIKELSKDMLFEIYKSGALMLAYSQIISSDNINKLGLHYLHAVQNNNKNKNLREVTLEKQKEIKKKELDDLVQNLIDSD